MVAPTVLFGRLTDKSEFELLCSPFYRLASGKLHEWRRRNGRVSVQFVKIIGKSVKKYLLFPFLGV